MLKSKISGMTLVKSVVLSLALIIPLSIAGIASTVIISENFVGMEEKIVNIPVTVVDGGDEDHTVIPYETEEGNPAFELVSEDDDENFTSDHKDHDVDVEISEDIYFCIYVAKPRLYNQGGNYKQSTLLANFTVDNVNYVINDDSEYAYYSIHHLESDGMTLKPMDSIDDVIFMTSDDPIDLVFTAERHNFIGQLTVLQVHIILQ